MAIHETAFVDGSAEIGSDVEIGPYCIIGPNVTIGDGTLLRNNVTILESTRLGTGNEVYPFAVLGGAPQDLKFDGEQSWAEIGDNNVIREYVTINRGTGHGGGKTIIGSGCLIMAYAHVAHDCIIGDEVIISNAGTLGGHIHVGRKAIISGLVAVHHFVTVGELAFLGGCSKVVSDAPPYMMTVGSPARVRAVNAVGLKRDGVSEESIAGLKNAYMKLFHKKANKTRAMAELQQQRDGLCDEVKGLLDFLQASNAGKKGRALEAHRSR
jgi:UDP-N-acetylglucosamine acyltransferase